MSVKIGKAELSILEMIFLLIAVFGFLLFYGTMVSDPDKFSDLSLYSLIIIIAGGVLFIVFAFKGCNAPEPEPLRKFEDMAQQLEQQQINTTPNPVDQTPRPFVQEELKRPTTKPKGAMFEEDVGDELLEEI